MLRFLLQKPVAVTMCTIAAMLLSIVAYVNLPVSLLPAIDVPQITITVSLPNSSPEEIEVSALRYIREAMLPLDGLVSSESIAQNEVGKLLLRFQFGTKMDLTYIEANEKLDRLSPLFPTSMDRPIVIKSNTSDIAIARIQVIPKDSSAILAVSELSKKILKRRIEQIEGVGLVDINGLEKKVIQITPHLSLLKSFGLNENDITAAVANSNIDLGSLSVKDGNYRYSLKMASKVTNVTDIENISILLPNQTRSVKLKQVAKVLFESDRPSGFHLYKGKQGIVITIHKQSHAKLPALMSKIYEALEYFKKDYPSIDFVITQDQSQLLTLSLQNLSQSLFWGGLFAFGVLFLFMRGWREPLIMGIVLPVSLLLAFSLFYIFKISLNIISLSGLALGLGMLVDNSIVVIDNIILKRSEGETLIEGCIKGTQEVIIPLCSSALTNLAVFLPLIFLSGITGALFFDQALSVASILSTSVFCTFIIVPLMYFLFFKNHSFLKRHDSRIFLSIRKAYEFIFNLIWKNKKMSLVLMILLIPLSLIILFNVPKKGFPDIERTESLVSIDWKEPIDVNENYQRIKLLYNQVSNVVTDYEAEVGVQQFILQTQSYSPQHVELYLKHRNEDQKNLTDKVVEKFLKINFPLCSVSIQPAPNAFEQIFSSDAPLLEARFRDSSKDKGMAIDSDSMIRALNQKFMVTKGPGFEIQKMAVIKIDVNNLNVFKIKYEDVLKQLTIAFGGLEITRIEKFGEVTAVVIKFDLPNLETVFNELEVTSNGVSYPIRDFVSVEFIEDFKNITADAAGVYKSVAFESFRDVEDVKSYVSKIFSDDTLTIDYEGKIFQNEKDLNDIIIIFLISLTLMYFILAAEFESLIQPWLVMLTFPIGLGGSLILLFLTGGSINIMSGVGFVVVLGILDNDAILKVDRINRLRKKMPLEAAIRQAGFDRLKPIVMNTFTNVLALVPIAFASGLGADLQRPVAITTIGGLVVGTFTALYFVPLLYWGFSKKDSLT
jgi:multidrug efflux pump subunit AcrB